ncbi:MAG: hypothetical protein ABSA83_20310 [Verrucomicrobiota bacterium]
MSESHIMACIAGGLQFLVAGYALRLNRRFGINRVGWSLFCAFSLLALLQLVQSAAWFDATGNTALKVSVAYLLLSFLLLIGMVHLEAMLKERARMERVEKELRAELESEVKSKTAHLTRAIEELMKEMEETKRMGAIIETSFWTKVGKTAARLAPDCETTAATAVLHPDQQTISEPTVTCCPVRPDSWEEPVVDGVLCGEWLAHL